jgi:hypothetical protein
MVLRVTFAAGEGWPVNRSTLVVDGTSCDKSISGPPVLIPQRIARLGQAFCRDTMQSPDRVSVPGLTMPIKQDRP